MECSLRDDASSMGRESTFHSIHFCSFLAYFCYYWRLAEMIENWKYFISCAVIERTWRKATWLRPCCSNRQLGSMGWDAIVPKPDQRWAGSTQTTSENGQVVIIMRFLSLRVFSFLPRLKDSCYLRANLGKKIRSTSWLQWSFDLTDREISQMT